MSELHQEIARRYAQQNRLHTLTFELTARCPCRCRHCYIVPAPQVDEMSTGEVCDVLDQARQEGVIQLMLTGGEVFLRTDLEAILAHARTHRFFVNILTSGLLVDEDAAAMLARHGVAAVEMSLLGATDAVNDDLMRVPGALRKIRAAAAWLRDAGLRVVLKATVMRGNAHELGAMAALARELRVLFHASPLLAPRRDAESGPESLALSEIELAALDQGLMGAGLLPGESSDGGAVLVCQAGRSVAGVTADGLVYPCVLWPRSVGSLRERSLHDIWHADPDPFLAALRAHTDAALEECQACTVRDHCRRCPGMAWQETGDITAAGPGFCQAAHQRAQTLGPPARTSS